MRLIFMAVIFMSLFSGLVFAETCQHLEKFLIIGQVVEVKHPVAVIKDENGQKYRVRLGPYWFWKKRGFNLQPGERVKVIAIKKGRLLFPISIEGESSGVLRIRNDCGLPLWRQRK
ncbi:hypothetical protein TH606_05550 [Thermodesulfatator autotrophicus]|uniref:Magnetosome protein MamS/MamX domain-containing protein n=2 Tax=Thermodesulfatator autotrophicus TaxID=1795632 RepID=A0A177E8W9_9BACT|nr:hypothetical protein TH606_05550 [Thermodesulfatator autotrophicus]